jgi:hypothetical protein
MPTCVGTLNVLAQSFGSKCARQRSQHELMCTMTLLAHRRSKSCTFQASKTAVPCEP